MESTPTWFKILNHFYENNYFANGLTIPFLVGAAKIIDPDAKVLSAADFIAQAADESLSRKISLQKCAGIGEYVFGIIDDETLKYPYGRAVTKQLENICITDNSFSDTNDIEGLKKALAGKYQNLLNCGHFSKNQGNWGKYSDIDTLRINELKPHH